jgi:quinol monooxygenase YgiN
MRERLGAAVLLVLACLSHQAHSQTPGPEQQSGAVVRIAEFEIAPAQLQAYLAAVKAEMDESIRVEPGVLAIYSVAEKDNLTHLRFFEIYANDAAYHSHIASMNGHWQTCVADFRRTLASSLDRGRNGLGH